ncbi:MAG: hypothetical protein ACOYMG_16800 [Candidatus Methylumidiphilus sp.]
MCSHLRMKTHDANMVIVLKTLLKAANIAFPLLCIACPSVALAYDFTFSAVGPNRVVSGHDIYIQELSRVTEGTTGSYAFHFVDGLPAGATVSWPTIAAGCCGGNRSYRPENTVLKINVPSTVATGIYPLTLRVESSDVKKAIPYQLIVEPVPGPLPKQVISAIPPIPSLSTWESNMKTYGKRLCNGATITSQGTWEGNVWFYDGIRVYFQIADYTGDASWNVCAGYVENVYKPYILAASGIQGWRVFPHGLYMDYSRTGDATSKDAAIRFSTNSAYSKYGGGISSGVNDDDGLQRETAYLVHAYRIAGLMGEPKEALYAQSVDFLLGMIDQQFVSKTVSYTKPFYTGLVAEALIQYYEETKDPRIPPAIKVALDEIWSRSWIPASNSFYYDSNSSPVGSPDLNLLIAPAYAWIYKLTGDPVYQQRGDLIFQGGVKGAWLDGGKQFSQNYRWSFDYVNWRMHPDIVPPDVPKSFKTVR